MEKLTFSTTIDATRDEVWRALWDDASYRDWTSVFAAGSYAVTDWKEGSKALFLSPAGDGLVSRIAVSRPPEFLSIEHLGTVKNGVEDLESPAARTWTGARETYTLTNTQGGVTLTVEMDSTGEHRPFFEKTWPQALDRIKRICEGRRGQPA